MIVVANSKQYTVRKHWRNWPMWSVVTTEGNPLGYVRASNETDALLKAIPQWGLEIIAEPFDGVL